MVIYIVKAGDTVNSIAQQYGVSVNDVIYSIDIDGSIAKEIEKAGADSDSISKENLAA